MGVVAALAPAAGKILAGASAITSVASLAGGISAQRDAQRQAAQTQAQANEAAAEKTRVSEREARLEQENIAETMRRQKVAYLASGVTLEGSPLLVMEETRRRGADNIDEILKGGRASQQATLAEGRLKAKQTKAAGRQAFVSGVTGAVSSGGKAYSLYQEA